MQNHQGWLFARVWLCVLASSLCAGSLVGVPQKSSTASNRAPGAKVSESAPVVMDARGSEEVGS